MSATDTKKSKISLWLFETGKKLKWLERVSEVNYTTLENLVFSRPICYQHRTLRDVAKPLKWTIPELLEDIVKGEYTKQGDIENVVKLCQRYGIETHYRLPSKKKSKKTEAKKEEPAA